MWKPSATGAYVRAGRFYAPYGLRLVEHIYYVRRFTGNALYEEPYALSGGYVADDWEVHATAFTPPPPYHQPGVHERGNRPIHALERVVAHRQIGQHHGNPFHFQPVQQPHQRRLDFQGGAGRVQTGDLIDDHHFRPEFGDELDRASEVHFQAVIKRPHGVKLEPFLFHPLLHIKPDRGHVAHDLAGGFLEGKEDAPLAALAGGGGKSRRHTRLARARGAREENAAPAIESFAVEHGVETLDAGRDALVRCGVFELDGSDRPDRNAILSR